MLYASSLYADTDLSCASLTWFDPEQTDRHTPTTPAAPVSTPSVARGEGPGGGPPPTPMSALRRQVGRGLSEACLHTPLEAIEEVFTCLQARLKGIADGSSIFGSIDTDGSGDISLQELRSARRRESESERQRQGDGSPLAAAAAARYAAHVDDEAEREFDQTRSEFASFQELKRLRDKESSRNVLLLVELLCNVSLL